MADSLDPVVLNVTGVTQLVESGLNKTDGEAPFGEEGIEGELQDELTLDMSDSELLTLRTRWVNAYAAYGSKIKTKQETSMKYYLGAQLSGSGFVDEFPIAANLIWEASETFYPAALSKNPEPVVFSDNTTEGNAESNDIKTMLQYHADVLGLRPKLNRMTRQWSVKFLGVLKHGWDKEVNEICTENRKIDGFIFDPDGYVDVFGNFVGYLGEPIECTAAEMILSFPDKETDIKTTVENELGTKATYFEWWSADNKFTFCTYKDIVLDSHKNEFFNYGSKEEDEFGFEKQIHGKNHFARPMKPYTFLSVYSFGEEPYDVTSNIEQNIPMQNIITKRTMQIDQNLSRQNNSDAFSENNFNQETAKQAANAFTKGHPVLVPEGGPIGEAIVRFPAEGFPDAAFKELEMSKEQLRATFGTQGITAQAADKDQTARGMILNQQYDNSRIGGGVGQALEGVAKNIFNWWTQMYYVFYDEPHFAAVLGQMKATEYAILTHQGFGDRKHVVTVAADSMKPHDEISQMNQALSLWQEGALDPKSLLTMLDFPDPQKTAAMTVLWKLNPMMYFQMNFKDVIAEMQQEMASQGIAPAGSPASAGAPAGAAPNGVPPVTNPDTDSTGGVPATAALSNVPLPK